MKAKLIAIAIRFVMFAVAIGVGIWYISSSIGGDALTYTSMDNFMRAIGAGDGNIANVNGCFMCGYIAQLFDVIGRAAEMFWGALLDYLWVLLVIGFGIYLFVHTTMYMWDNTKTSLNWDGKEQKLDFKKWFDPIWKLALRIIIVGAILGLTNMGGIGALRAIVDIIMTPVLFIGGQLAMVASGVSDAATCGALVTGTYGNVLNPIYEPFMCVIGNINSIMLAGAAGGFSMMNYAWMGLGGGILTWVAGLSLVMMFLIIGFDLFFQILSVFFKLIFIVIFLPILVASYAFEGTWKMADGLIKGAIDTIIKSAIKIVIITLKVLITYAIISYAADATMPGPVDGYTSILPPMMGRTMENPDSQSLAVANVFSTCEHVALSDGEMDGDKFKECFIAERQIVEQSHPGAFDFLDDGWDFLTLMMGLFFVYFYIIQTKVNGLLGKEDKESFDFGGNILNLGKKAWALPANIAESVTNKLDGKS